MHMFQIITSPMRLRQSAYINGSIMYTANVEPSSWLFGFSGVLRPWGILNRRKLQFLSLPVPQVTSTNGKRLHKKPALNSLLEASSMSLETKCLPPSVIHV